MNLASSRTIAATLALLAAIALSGCNKTNESASTNSQGTPNNSSTSPSPSSSATPPASTPVASGQGVAPQGTTCPNENPIKAVNSKRLGKIALTTNSPQYSTIKPEKCFPDTATAENAGYKVPK